MGIISTGSIVMIGNFTKPKRYKNIRPKDWFDRDYKAIVPYDFKFRAKLGRAECTCKECLECHQPYYGFTYFHSEECAISQHLKKYPQILNLIWWYDPTIIAQSD